MKKIIFVATTPFVVNAFLSAHLNALSQKYEVMLCVNLNAYPVTDALSEKIRIIDLKIERKISLFRDVAAFFKLIGIFSREKPDAVHSITPKAGLLSMSCGFLTMTPRRYHTFTGQVWATKRGVRRAFYKILDRLLVSLTTQIFADSPSQCRFLENEGVVRPDRISVLGGASISGVDPARFTPDKTARTRCRQELNASDKSCVFLFVGRIAKDKGIFDLVRAFAKVAKRAEPVELWIVGPDDEGLLSELAQQRLPADVRIQYPGTTQRPEYFMAAADILVLPSYREGFGTVIIEAAACSIPSIASRIPGIVDAIVEGKTGILVPAGDLKALADAMYEMSCDVDRRISLGENAIKRARQEFSSAAVTAAWMEHYRNEFDE